MMHSSILSISPPLLAALLAEQTDAPPERIGIHPADGRPGIALREVLEVQRNRPNGEVSIIVGSKSEQRLAVERDLPEGHPFQTLLKAVECEMTLFQIETMQRERAHVLGLSPIQPSFFAETKPWEKDHQKILSFFLPYGSQIRGDMVLMEKCLSAALGQAVQVGMIGSKKHEKSGILTQTGIVDTDCIVGGLCVSTAPCVQISIGPIPVGILTDYVPGGRQQRFLEKALLPHFLPEGWEYETRITVAPEYQSLRIADPECPHCVDINTMFG